MQQSSSPHLLLSIVIVNWNTAQLLAECLDSLYVIFSTHHVTLKEQVTSTTGVGSPCSCEVFVVDNHSHDESVNMVRERYPWVTLIANDTNVGFARANNQAIAAASGKYLLLLNPDTVVKPGALTTLLAFMESHERAGAVGPRLLNGDQTLQPSCSPAPTLWRELWRLFHLDRIYPYAEYPLERWSLRQAHEVDVIKGACLLMRRAVVEQVGGLDEAYFIYSEEVDLCKRIQQAGWQLHWLPQAEVIHYGAQSTQLVAREMFLNLYRYKVLYFRKRHGETAAGLYKLILLLASLARLLASPFACLTRGTRRQQCQALTGNYWRLLRLLPQF